MGGTGVRLQAITRVHIAKVECWEARGYKGVCVGVCACVHRSKQRTRGVRGGTGLTREHIPL